MEDQGQIVIYAAYILIGLATFIVARMLLEEQESIAAQENLADLRDRQTSNPLVKLLRPIFTQYLVPVIRGKPFWDERRKYYRRKVIAAGIKDELTADEFISFKVLLIVFFPLRRRIFNRRRFPQSSLVLHPGFGRRGLVLSRHLGKRFDWRSSNKNFARNAVYRGSPGTLHRSGFGFFGSHRQSGGQGKTRVLWSKNFLNCLKKLKWELLVRKVCEKWQPV